MMEIQKVKEVVIELQVVDGKATTTSRQVAEMFNKEHKDVLKIIKNLVEQLDFNQRNFAPVDYNKGIDFICKKTRLY